jgi:hypothetical protein
LRIRLLLAAVAALVVTAIAGAGGASAVQGHQSKYEVVTKDCINSITGQDEGDITWNGPTTVWPPNHKYVSATISVTDADDEPATDAATVEAAGSHDQVLEDGTEMNGSGNTDPATDATPGAGAGTPTASTVVQFRAERSGHKWTDGDPWRGRTYTYTVTGTTDNGLSTCDPVTFTANVPHDQGNHTGSSKTTAKKLSAKKLAAKRLAAKRRAAR